MKTLSSISLSLGILVLSEHANATLIYESARVSTTLDFHTNYAYGFSATGWIGSRFPITGTTNVTSVGLNLFNGGSPHGTVFVAIVPISPVDGFPEFNPRDIEANAIGSAVFSPVVDSQQDIHVPMIVTLPVGEYALFFGSGAFGAEGNGVVTAQQPPWTLDHMIGANSSAPPNGIAYVGGFYYENSNAFYAQSSRFFIEGDGPPFVPDVPEPYGPPFVAGVPEASVSLMLLVGTMGLLGARRRRR